MKSLEVREFKQTISNYVQGNPLPDEVKRMVLSEILKQQEEVTLLTLRKEIEERDCAEKEAMQDAENIQQD